MSRPSRHSIAYIDDIDELLKNTATLSAWEANRMEFGNINFALRKKLYLLLQQNGWDETFKKKRRHCLTAGHRRVATEDNLGQLNNPTVLTLIDIIVELCKKANVEIK